MKTLLHVGNGKFSEAFALSFREGIFHKHSKHVMDMLSHFETIQHLRAQYLWCPPICMVKMGRKELNKKPNHGRFFNDVSFFISVYFLSLPVFSFAKVRHHTTFCNQKTCNKLPKKNITSVYLRSFFFEQKIRRNLCRSNVSHNRRWNVARAYQISSRISQSKITTTTALSCCSVAWIKVVSVGPRQIFWWRRKSLLSAKMIWGFVKFLHQKGSNLLKVLKSVLVRRTWIHIVVFWYFVEYQRNFTTTNARNRVWCFFRGL